MPRRFLLSIPVDAVTRREALDRCRQFLHDGKQHRIVTVNPEFVVEAQRNAAFRETLQTSDLALADGRGITLAARLQGWRIPERIPGVDFLVDLCRLASEEQAAVFLLGGRGGVAERTARALAALLPRLRIAGWSESVEDAPRAITTAGAAVLFAALGAPLQELWIAAHLARLPSVKIAMGVGGAFDLLSGRLRRAPRLLRAWGLEWLWRLALEPRRLRRVARAVLVFPKLLYQHRCP